MRSLRIVSAGGDHEFQLFPLPLGRGGFGTVYRALSQAGTRYAVKLVPLASDQAASTRQRRAFTRETSHLQQLRHPNIVQYMFHGEAPDFKDDGAGGALVLVMEYVDGPTLADRIGPGGVGRTYAYDYVEQLGQGLQWIHAQTPPIVHRDIKPGNLVLGQSDGRLRIVDFGLGRELAPDARDASAMAGTPRYMAPEQLAGGIIDARTDLYGASLVAYELLFGTVPLCRDTGFPDKEARERGWEKDGTDLTSEQVSFFERALAGDPAKRFQNAMDFLEAHRSAFKLAKLDLARSSTPIGTGRTGPSQIVRGNRWEDYRDGCIEAIELEIKAVQDDLAGKGVAGPVEVRDGRREDRAPDYSVYSVQAPNDLVIAEDTPLQATIGRHIVRGRVLACRPDSGTMSLSLFEDQGDGFDRAMLQFDTTFILEKLRDKLGSGSNARQPALALQLIGNTGTVAEAPSSECVSRAPLNEDQVNAVRTGLASSVSYIWGPPGTGKTRTVGHLVASLLAKGKRTAALTPTNVAADTLALSILNVSDSVVRRAVDTGLILRLGEISKDLRSRKLNLDWAFECTANERLSHVVQAIEELWNEYRQLVPRERSGELFEDEKQLLRARFHRMRRRMVGVAGTSAKGGIAALAARIAELESAVASLEAEAISRAKVVVTTLSKFHLDSRLESQAFASVVVDEVSMAQFPALLYAALSASERVVVAGDFRQLPPVVISDDSKVKRWLGTDIFVIAGIDDPTAAISSRPLLAQQYRMHPVIARIVSELFYEGQLRTARDDIGCVASNQGVRSPPWRGAVALLDTSATEAISERTQGQSRINPVHAREVARAVAAAVDAGHRGIAVVTPYSAQAHLIRDMLRGIDAGYLSTVRIGTVHRVQGQEASLVVFDTVDAPPLPVRFLNDRQSNLALRLINVAISRARHKLLVVAHEDHLSRELSTMSRLIKLLEEVRQCGREFVLADRNPRPLQAWLLPDPGNQANGELVPGTIVMYKQEEALVVRAGANEICIIAAGVQYNVPPSDIAALKVNGKWVLPP